MVLQKTKVAQNICRISRVSKSRFFAVMCVSESLFSIAKLIHGLSSLSRENLKIPSSIFLL